MKTQEGVSGIFLTGATQQLFGCVCDEQVTRAAPHKLIPKQSILDDLIKRAAVSDFSPFKAQLQAYTGSEVLIVYDPDFEFGENFYICLTEDARVATLQAKVEEAEQQEEAAKQEELELVQVKAKREPGVWKSLGSETEIAEAAYAPTRSLLKLLMSRRRRLFGGPYRFAENNQSDTSDAAASSVEIKSTPINPEAPPELHRTERDVGTQSIPEVAHAFAQTNWAYPRNAITQTAPRILEKPLDQLEATRVHTFVESSVERITNVLGQNVLLDLFNDDYGKLAGQSRELLFVDQQLNKMKEYQSFKYMHFPGEMVVTAVDWHPERRGLVGVAYARKASFDERVDTSSKVQKSFIIIWNFANSLKPQAVLEAIDDIHAFRFNPLNPSVAVGGCVNGQVVVWEIPSHVLDGDGSKLKGRSEDRKLSAIRAVAVSTIETSHKTTITDIHWIPNTIEISKNGHTQAATLHECFQITSIAADGTALFWDTRIAGATKHVLAHLDLNWKPFFKVMLTKPDHGGDHGGVKISLSLPSTWLGRRAVRVNKVDALKHNEQIVTKLYVGTEQGEVLHLDWKTADVEGGRPGPQKIDFSLAAHAGCVAAVLRSPYVRDVVLTVGGFSISVWKEGLQWPLFYATTSGARVTAAAWSQSRMSVFYVAREDGRLDAWDLIDSTAHPAMTQEVSGPASITVLETYETLADHFIACGDSAGLLRVIELPVTLTRQVPNEEVILEAWIQKECQRIEYIKGRQQKRAATKPKPVDTQAASAKEETATEKTERLKPLTTAFSVFEKKFTVDLGLAKAAEEDD